MSRRTLTLLLASLLAAALAAGAAQARVPYVALGPGPTYNTLGEVDGQPVIVVEGRQTFPTDGNLDLTTVGVQSQLTLVTALRGWFARDLAVVPREVVYPPGRSDDQVQEKNAELMRESQGSAVTAAARQLGLRVAEVSVAEITPGAPATGRLEVGDVLTTVDGTSLRDAAELRALIGAKSIGDSVQVGLTRGGQARTVVIPTGESSGDGPRRPVIGVVTQEKPIDAPFTVDITLEEVGGPSAGLMFTLGILDKLDEPSLTAGKYIAGTGEISADGTVGPIGGIVQKLTAAKAKGAVAFLVPAGNCAEAVRRPPPDLLLIRVATIEDALAGLDALGAGRPLSLCTT
ncbi:MAG: PDZ domain-containing protein [Actinomycetota bacterium]|nr:PDZ domain-containing protein [Actinomycetota bacterium]